MQQLVTQEQVDAAMAAVREVVEGATPERILKLVPELELGRRLLRMYAEGKLKFAATAPETPHTPPTAAPALPAPRKASRKKPRRKKPHTRRRGPPDDVQ